MTEALLERRTTAAERYLALKPKRDRYLLRARNCSALTIPQLITPEGHTDGEELAAPAQVDGAIAVNSLAAKMLLGLVPPNICMFKLELSDIASSFLAAEDEEIAKGREDLKVALPKIQREALMLTEHFQHRPVVFEGMKHLIVGGNVLMWFMGGPKKSRITGKIRAIPLSHYVVLRDSTGFVLEVVMEESLNAANLPKKLRDILDRQAAEDGLGGAEQALTEASESDGDDLPTTPYLLYTRAYWDPARDRYIMSQEFEGEIVPGTSGVYKVDDFPLAPLCFSRSDGEDYGRGLVEEHYGILQAIEAIAQSEASLAISMSDLKWGVSPAANMRAAEIEEAPANSYLDVDAQHVKALVAEKYGDLGQVSATAEKLQRKFGLAFLVATAIQRPGERVTAEEIRTMIQMLDSTLGGIYSALSAEFQTPYARYQLRLLKTFHGLDLNRFGSGAVRPRVLTGIDALGQTQEAMQTVSLFRSLGEIFGQEAVAKRSNIGNVGKRLSGNFNVDPDGLFKTDAQVQAEAQAEARAAENKAAVGPIINQAGKALTDKAA